MILKKLDELENLIDVPNVDENAEQSIKAMKMLNAINDIRKAVKNNAVLQIVSKSALLDEWNNGYCRGCEDTAAAYENNR